MSFDVFLSHNSHDKPAVKTLGVALKQRGLTVWLDEWELRPGLDWQDALEDIITDCNSAAVCFGSSGVGPWEDPEMKALLRRFVKDKKRGNLLPIIPVLLPGAPETVELPIFLEAKTWVDLRRGLTPDGLERLRWGITGEKPLANAPTVCLAKVTPDLRKSRDTVANYLTSAKLNALPGKPYPGTFLPALEADLKQADVFVQILGETYSDRTDELPEGEEIAQFKLAQKSGKVILQWRDKSVKVEDIDDPAHKELVGGADVVCNDLTEFAKLVTDRARRVHENGQPAGGGGGAQFLALIKADKADCVVADEVSQALIAGNVNNRVVTRAGKKLVDALREVPYDAVLIVYGACSDDWLEERGDELIAVDMDLKDLAPVRAYYVCADDPQLPYRGKGMLQIKRRDEEGWKQLMAAIQQRGKPAMTDSPENLGTPPYVGLRPFEFDEATLFYGRGEHVAEMVRTLRKKHFLAVIGSSGSGKSSLVRAGLLPAIAAGFMHSGADDVEWRFVIMRPGRDPYENLLAALLPQLAPGQVLDEDIVDFRRQTVRGGPRGLVEAVADSLLPEPVRLVVLVDQFEEIFRFLERGGPIQPSDGGSVADRRNAALAFVDMLLATAEERDPRVFVVLTMRSEYLGDCEAFLGLSTAIAKSQFLTPRLTREQVQDVIERPLAAVGGRLEPQVVTALLNSLGTAQDQLPRVEHALLRMWDRAGKIREEQPETNEPLTFKMDDYQAVGRFETALDLHGEQLFWDLGPESTSAPFSEKQRVAERMFRALAVFTSQGTLVRRLSSIAEVASIAGVSEQLVAEVVEHFRQPGCNFVVATPLDQPPTGKTTLDISHESLLRQWKRMGEWAAAEERSARRYRRLLETAILEKEGNAGLWYDPELQIALDWQKEEAPTAPWAALYGGEFATATAFLEKSRLERDTKSATAILDRRWKMTWRFAVIAISAAVAYAIYCSEGPNKMRTLLPPPKAAEQNSEPNAKSLKEIPPAVEVDQSKGAEDVGAKLRARVEGEKDKIISQVEERKKEKANVIGDFLATLIILGPAIGLFLVLDYAGKWTFRRAVFGKILKEVADSTDKTLREEKLKKELARKAITDPAAALQTTYASFWRRVGAHVLDASLFLFAGVMLVAGILNIPVLDKMTYSWTIVFVCDWIYAALMLTSRKQSTLGMRAMGIFVADQHAEPLRFRGATAWHFATLLSYVTVGLGFLFLFWTKRRQTLPDLVTRTVVLSTPDQKKVPWWLILFCILLAVPLFAIYISVIRIFYHAFRIAFSS